MNKIRLLSKQGDGLGVAFLCSLEGKDCSFWLKDPKGKHVYKGLPIKRVGAIRDNLDKDTCILFDMVGMGNVAQKLKDEGYMVYGAGIIQDEIELNRSVAIDLADSVGMKVPYSEDFKDFDKAIAMVKGKKSKSNVPPNKPIEKWVFKPEGNKGCAKTYPAASLDDTIGYLEYAKNHWEGEINFVLQESIDGTEVSSEVWFINGNPIKSTYNNTLELKRFLNNDLGPNTGCMFSAVKFNACPKLYSLFEKIMPWCKKNKFNGPLDINCMIADDKKPYMLEFTPRMGYSAMYAFIQGINMPISDLIILCANGTIPNLSPSKDWMGALRLTIPPYPHSENAEETKDWPIHGLHESGWNNIVPLDIMVGKDGELYGAGFDGIICEVVDKDADLKTMCLKIEKHADNLIVPDKQYRTDFYENINNRLKSLKDSGYYG